MKNLFRRDYLFLLFCVVGFFALAWSANDWFNLMDGSRTSSSFCAINSFWDCDRASLSRTGSLFGVLPVALLGMVWFAVVGILAFVKGLPRWYLQAFLALGCLAVVFFGYQLFFVLKTGCLICVVAYASIIGATITGFKAFPSEGGMKLTTAIFSAVIALAIIGVFAATGFFRLQKRDVPISEIEAWVQNLPRVNVPLSSPFRKGDDAAPIKIVEFAAFTCGHCQAAAAILGPFFESRKDVQVFFQPFPFDPKCNPAFQGSRGAGTCELAKASLCAQKQKRFWDYHDYVFEYVQDHRSIPSVSSVVKELEMEQASFTQCMTDPETNNEFQKIMAVGKDLGIQSTPTFFVNGLRLEGMIGLPVFQRILDYLGAHER